MLVVLKNVIGLLLTCKQIDCDELYDVMNY